MVTSDSKQAAGQPNRIASDGVKPAENHKLLVLITVLGGLLFYGLTCAPGVLWQDSAMFQFRVWHGELRGDLGLPLAHPLYILLARLLTILPIGDFAFRVNLFSVLCGAATLGIAMHLLLVLTRSRLAAATATVLLAVSHTFWTHSVIAEVYNLYALGLLIELSLIQRFSVRRRWIWLALALFTNGLNLSNHLLAILHAPAYAAILIWALRAKILSIRHTFYCVGLFLVGTAPYSALILQDIFNGQSIIETLKLALVGPPNRADRVLITSFDVVSTTARTAQYFLMNFPTPVVLLAPVGLWVCWKDPRTRLWATASSAIFVAAFIFALRYLVPDQFVFFTPCYVLVSLFVGLAIPRVVRQSKALALGCLALAVLPCLVYEIAPSTMQKLDISIGTKRDIPFRDTLTYFIRPRKNGETSAARFAHAALEQAAPDGLLIADITIKNLLVYVRDVEGVHRGVTLTHGPDTTPAAPAIDVTPEAIAGFVDRDAAYICSTAPGYVPPWIVEQYDCVPAGGVFRLRPKADGTALGESSGNSRRLD